METDDRQTKLKVKRMLKHVDDDHVVIDPVAIELEQMIDADAETQPDHPQTVGDDHVDRDSTAATTGDDNKKDAEISTNKLSLADMIQVIGETDPARANANWESLKPKLDMNFDRLCIETAGEMSINLQKQVDSLKLDHQQATGMPAKSPTINNDANTAIGDLTPSEIKTLNEIREMEKKKGGFDARSPCMQKMMRDPKIAAQMQGMDKNESKEFRKRWADDLKDKRVMDLGLVG